MNDGGTHYVLLQDDALISEVSIVSDNLLLLPNLPRIGTSDAFLIIDVKLEVEDKQQSEGHLVF